MSGVPDVVNKEIKDAKTAITDAGFEVGEIEEVFNKDVEKDHVISQDPSSFMRAMKGSKINLQVSKGAEMVVVPDVKDKTRTDASEILKDKGFEVELTEDAYDKDIEAGKVCKQDPEGNTKAAKGSTVKITISKGAEKGDVPNVTNLSESDARASIERAGFVCAVNYSASETVEEGFVMSQNPSGGQKADKGSTVTITVSKGSDKVTVPDVTGMTPAQAKSMLESMGLSVVISGSGTTRVNSQSPSAGSKVPKGTTITLFCS